MTNLMSHMSECDFDGPKTWKYSEKAAVLAGFWGKIQGKCTKKFRNLAGEHFFHYLKFRNLPEIGQIYKNLTEIWPKSVKCETEISNVD